MKLKRKALVSLLLLACMLLSGCAGRSGLTPVEGWERDTGTREITLHWYYGSGLTRTMAEAVIHDYYEQTGVRVEWISTETMNLQELFASGVQPDVFSVPGMAIQNWLPRLAELNDLPFTQTAYAPALNACTVNGRVVAMPISSEACGLVYNKALFEKAGITNLPETVSELEDVCKALKRAGILPFRECYQLPGFCAHTMAVLYAYQPDLPVALSAMADGEMAVSDLEHFSDWLTFFQMTSDYGIGKDSCQYSIDEQISDFAAGKMAMIKQGTWLEKAILEQNPELSLGLMAIPCSDSPEDTKLMVSTTTFLAVHKYSDHQEEAIAFLNWLYENMEYYFVQLDGMSVCYTNVSTETLGALNRDAQSYIAQGRAFDGFGYEQWPSGYIDDILPAFQHYLNGVTDAVAFAEELTQSYRLRAGIR